MVSPQLLYPFSSTLPKSDNRQRKFQLLSVMILIDYTKAAAGPNGWGKIALARSSRPLRLVEQQLKIFLRLIVLQLFFDLVGFVRLLTLVLSKDVGIF
jgi:hypothetical protein